MTNKTRTIATIEMNKASIYSGELHESLFSIDYWCMLVLFFIGNGPGFLTLTNLSQITLSKGGTLLDSDNLAMYAGIFNCLGSMAIGILEKKND